MKIKVSRPRRHTSLVEAAGKNAARKHARKGRGAEVVIAPLSGTAFFVSTLAERIAAFGR